MMDHLTNNRFEWGTGRGAGSHEMASFNILDKNSTKPEWNEVVQEVRACGSSATTCSRRALHRTDTPQHPPKPYGKGHPPIWVACGNPGTFTTAGEMGIGAIASTSSRCSRSRAGSTLQGGVAACTNPIGQFKNDNVMITNA